MATPYTEDELRDIIRDLERGLRIVARGVTFADRGTTYRSTDEILKAIDYFKHELAVLTGGRAKQSVAVAAKGF